MMFMLVQVLIINLQMHLFYILFTTIIRYLAVPDFVLYSSLFIKEWDFVINNKVALLINDE